MGARLGAETHPEVLARAVRDIGLAAQTRYHFWFPCYRNPVIDVVARKTAERKPGGPEEPPALVRCKVPPWCP